MKKFFILLLGVIATVCLFVGCEESNSSSKLPSSQNQSVSEQGNSLQTSESLSTSTSSQTTSSSSTNSSLQDDAERCLTYLSTSNGYVVYNCDESAVNVVIPEKLKGENVVGIYKSAFFDCDSLTSVTIPDSVTSIGSYAFYDCDSLTSVTIPDSVTSIGDGALEDCTSLTSVTIPDSVTSIGDSAFRNCTSLQYNEENGFKYLGNSTNPYLYLAGITSTSITTVTINSNCKFIGSYAFSGCTSLTSVTIPDSVISIGDSAFSWCDSLTSVTIGDSVTSIGMYAFSGCTRLTSVTFKNTSGWYRTQDSTATSGEAVDVTNAETNATNLKSNYYDCYWKRNA